MSPKIYFRPGQEVNGYRILARLGHGGFSSIYFAEYLANGQRVALKLELTNQRKKALKYEREICLKLRGCRYVPEFQRFAETRNFLSLAMECLGPSVIALRRELPDSHFSLSTTLRIGIEVIRGLRELHSRGILHRDVKPSNILVRPSCSRPIALIDFGLSRQFIDPNTGESYPPRVHPGFVGTHYYASTNALRGCEVSQRDDLMSLLFSLVEIRMGRTPGKTDRYHLLSNFQRPQKNCVRNAQDSLSQCIE
jgi:serine/threonine protein kinase